MFVLICIHILYLQNIVVFSCDGLAGHLWEDFLTCAGNGINWVQYWGHDRRKLQRRKSKKHQFTQHFYQKVISCRLCAEKLAFKKQKFDDESAVYRIKKKVSGLTLVVLQPDHNTATTSSRPICVCEAEISTPAGVTKATAHRGAG